MPQGTRPPPQLNDFINYPCPFSEAIVTWEASVNLKEGLCRNRRTFASGRPRRDSIVQKGAALTNANGAGWR